MRRIVVLIMLLGLCASLGWAADESASEGKSGKPVAEKSAPPKAKEPPAEGFLWRSLGGEKFTKKTGITVDNNIQVGYSHNNTGDAGAQNAGLANFPIGIPGDTGWHLQQMAVYVHRDIKTNAIPRVTPTPAPMPTKFDWGFMAEGVYGRGGQACDMYRYDNNWGPNDPGSYNPPLAQRNRQNFLCTPNMFGQVFLPVGYGIAVTGGRFGSGVGYDIPEPLRPGPGFLYSHTYSAYANMWQHMGVLVSANLMRSQKNGYLMGEFGVNNGDHVLYSPSASRGFEGALRWRSPHMSTWIDYAFQTQNINVDPTVNSPNAYFPTYHVISPRGQRMYRMTLNGQHDFNPRWKMMAEFVYGKVWGDGQADTFLLTSPAPIPGQLVPGFKGAKWAGANAMVIYRFNPKWAGALRVEQFRNPDGFALYPLTANTTSGPPIMNGIKGDLNDVTFGINYDPSKFVRLRPEIRYDFQTANNNTGNAFGQNNTNGKRYTSQVTASIDLVLYF